MISTSGILLILPGHWVDFTLTKEHLCGEIIKNAHRRPRLFIGSNANLLLANTVEASTSTQRDEVLREKKGRGSQWLSWLTEGAEGISRKPKSVVYKNSI
jgi:hypothetical protein